tara:strand:- start:452 stop:685 length:234 start_codon:yes stop_codon:yes gene_type:complete
MTNLEKAKHDLNILEKEYKPTFEDAVMALRVLKTTINIRNGTKEDFDINEDDIRVCDAAFDCIMEDINYNCYLENTK